jgi:signal transduction histidine kinase
VLHSVGNVLNSVNVSATLVTEIIARSKTNNLPKVVAMMMEHRADLGQFFRDDPRGQKLPEYFGQLAELVERDNATARAELQSLTQNVDHIKDIVGSQQALVKTSDVVESVDVDRLLDEALELHAAAWGQHAIEIVRAFEALPQARLDRYKVLQILIVLLANARDSVLARRDGRQIVLRAGCDAGGNLEIVVEDNGCGIAPENRDRIFGLGFTTKPGGHGMGLHYSACAARALKGQLTVRSEGVGAGAAFSLVLPFSASA